MDGDGMHQDQHTDYNERPAIPSREQSRAAFAFVYTFRHIRRSAWKSVLVALLAALLLGTVSQLSLMQITYFDLYMNTVITARIIGGLQLASVEDVVASGFFADPYYEADTVVDINSSLAGIVVTNDISRYIGANADITYADGYDAHVMGAFGYYMVAVHETMDMYGLELGGTVRVSPADGLLSIHAASILEYRRGQPEESISDEEILELQRDEITKKLDDISQTYTVAGYVSLPEVQQGVAAFMPGSRVLHRVTGSVVKLDISEFILADNMQAAEARTYGARAAYLWAASGDFYMDTSRLESLEKTLWLLDDSYPIAVIAALLIGAFLCAFVVLQSSKEAAIMRSLGTTRLAVCIMLALEQGLLNAVGLAIGAAGFAIYSGAVFETLLAQLCRFIAIYFIVAILAAIISGTLVVCRNSLELLQVKE